MNLQPSLREQYIDLKGRHEPLLRAAIRLIAAFDPCDPSEAATLVSELGISAGISSQHEAEAILRTWQTPVHSSHGPERMRSVEMSGGMRVR